MFDYKLVSVIVVWAFVGYLLGLWTNYRFHKILQAEFPTIHSEHMRWDYYVTCLLLATLGPFAFLIGILCNKSVTGRWWKYEASS